MPHGGCAGRYSGRRRDACRRAPISPVASRDGRKTQKRERNKMTTLSAQQSVLSDELLARCAQRAPIYDRENRFFGDDFEELRRAGYLRMPIPQEFGGMGFSLAEVCREQRRLAYHAPATALAVN